jgi:hypothetical protein
MNKDKWNKRNQKRLKKKATRDKSNSIKQQRRIKEYDPELETNALAAMQLILSREIK